MSANPAIEFFSWKDDEPIEIQLEPECIIFRVMPGNSIKFVATICASDFVWATRIVHKGDSIQLFPDSLNNYDIEVYENETLLLDWYKYM